MVGVVLALVGVVRTSAPSALDRAAVEASALIPTADTVAAQPEAVSTGASSASITSTAETTMVSLRIVQPTPVHVTVGELYQALARSPWPSSLWSEVVRISRCEAVLGSGVDAHAEGDGGRALGVLQIRVDAHPDLARQYNLLTVDGALDAAWIVYQRAGNSFRPWSCA